MTETVSTEVLNEILSGCEGVTPGPYEIEEIENRDDSLKFTSYAVSGVPFSNSRKCIVDTLNSGAMSVTVEYDEEGYSAWDRQGYADIKHLARLDPATVSSIVTELLALRAEVERLREALAKIERHNSDRTYFSGTSATLHDIRMIAITAYLAAVQPDEPSEVAVRKMRSDWPDRQADALIIAEREACAKMMDDHAEAAKQMSQEARYPILGKFYQYRSEAYAHGADVIRARTA